MVINRLRAGVVKTKANKVIWGYQEGIGMCECDEVQSNEHLLQCVLAPTGYTIDDLAIANKRRLISIAIFWLKQNI